jgi:hypothetical protein
LIPAIRFFVHLAWLERRPAIPADRLADMAIAAAKDADLEKSVRRLGRLALRSQAAIDRQVRRKEQIDRRVLVVTDAILAETLRRVRLVRPDTDPAVLVEQLKQLRKMRYKRAEAEALAGELLTLAPAGDFLPKRHRPNRRRRGPFWRRVFKVRPEALARDAASAVKIRDPALRHVRLLWLAQRGRSEVDRQVGRAKGVDQRLLVVTHGVLVASMRQARVIYSSAGTSGGEMSTPFEDMLAELQTLAYDQNEGERFATELANIPLHELR